MSNQGWGAPPPGNPPPGGFGPPPGPAGSPFGGFGPSLEKPPGPPGGYPGAAPGTPFGGGGGPGLSQPWGIWESITFAWDRAKTDPGTIMGALIVGGLIANAFNGIGQVVGNIDKTDQTLQFVVLGLNIINFLVSTFMSGGLTLFAIKVARGDDYQFGDIFKGGPVFLSILGANILISLGVLFGMVLLIVPGIILGLAWGMTVPLIVDRQMGAIDAMKESWRMMDGHKATVFLWGLLAALLVFVGLLACCVGAFLVGPIIQIAYAFIYLRISGQRTAELSVAA